MKYSNTITINDARRYAAVDGQLRLAAEIERGEHDSNFTVQQRMHYFLTGDDLPLLP